jgi:hypothetical protein
MERQDISIFNIHIFSPKHLIGCGEGGNRPLLLVILVVTHKTLS